MIRTALLSLATVALLAACGAASTSSLGSSQSSLTAADTDGILAMVNDQANTDLYVLDVTCALRSDSAKKIIKHRDGRDKTPFTGDDNLFGSIAELEGVAMVGPWTIDQLRACAIALGYTIVPVSLAGTGTATIDGYMSAGEWDGAGAYSFDADIGDGNSVPATLYMMDDGANLYIAVAVEQSALPSSSSFRLLFDNDADGIVRTGDDLVQVSGDSRRASYTAPLYDGHIRFGAGLPTDTEYGGTTDGAGAIANDGTLTVLEVSHPLSSGDAFDLDLGPGDVTSFSGFVVLPHHSGTGVRRTFMPPTGGAVSGWGFYTVSNQSPPPPAQLACLAAPQECIDFNVLCGVDSQFISDYGHCVSDGAWAMYDDAEGDPYYFCETLFERCIMN